MKNVVVFDIDGTVLDTTEFILKAFEHVITVRGEDMSRDRISAVIGKPLVECYKDLLSVSDEDARVCAEMHRNFQLQNLHLSAPFPGAHAVLETLKKNGMTLTACTTRSKTTSFDTLRTAGIFDLFDAITTLEDTPRLKPFPDPVLHVLSLVRADPSSAVMVGDSWVDVAAGQAAGLQTIRALYGVNQERLHDPEPTAFVSSITELPDVISKVIHTI